VLIFRLLLLTAFVLLSGCANFSVKPIDSKEVIVSADSAGIKGNDTQKESKTSIEPDVLFILMTAELAGQRGQYEVAFDGYITAAKRTQNPKYSERALMIAMYVKNPSKINEALELWLKQDPNNPAARKIAVLYSLRSENKLASTQHLNALLDSDPLGFEGVLLELSGVLQKEGKIDRVYETLDDLLKLHPEKAEIYFVQSMLAMQKKDKNLAEAKIQQVLKLRPDWDKAIIFKAQIDIFSGDFKKAKLLLKEALLKYPKNIKFSKMLAQVLIKTEEYREAIDVYKRVVSMNPKDYESHFSMGLIYMQLNHDNDADAIFKQLVDQPEWKYQAYFYLGKIEEKQGHLKKAIGWFDKVIDGSYVFDASISSVSLLQKDNQLDEAGSRLSFLQTKFPKQKVRLLLAQVELFSQQKQYDKAYNLLNVGLAEFPDQKNLLYTRALMAGRMGKSDVVEADLKKLLSVDPDNIEALNALGYTLLANPNRYADAEKYLEKALSLAPDEAVVIDSYGWLLFKRGDLMKALGYLEKAYSKQHENEIAVHLAEVLWELGKRDDAEKLVNKAMKETPNDEFLLDFKRRVLKSKK
jgi:tetratricopeptide (TPR) repeat protein